jgi:hypothetical protein
MALIDSPHEVPACHFSMRRAGRFNGALTSPNASTVDG